MFPRDPGDERPGPEAGVTALLPLAQSPCPSCVAFLDQLDGAAGHASQRINFAVVAKSTLPRILTFADERGWRRLRLLSSAGTTYNRDYHAETAEGAQRPMLNVFHRDGDTIRHFWGSELLYARRPRTRPPSRRHARTALEPVRPHPRGTANRLGRAAELRLTVPARRPLRPGAGSVARTPQRRRTRRRRARSEHRPSGPRGWAGS